MHYTGYLTAQGISLHALHVQSQMVREQRAHQAAVVKFLAEMEARNKLQLECNKLMVRNAMLRF